MKQLLRLCAVLSLVGAAIAVSSSAFAGSVSPGINMSWTDCASFGTADKTFGCTVNTGNSALVGSVVAPAGTDSVLGMAAVIDLTTATDPLPAWWTMQAGGCRPTSVSSVFSFGALASCADFWAGQAFGGYNYSITVTGSTATASATNYARLRVACAQTVGTVTPMVPGTEYYMFEAVINNAKSTGAGSCGGCLTPVCLLLNSILLVQPLTDVNGDQNLTAPPPGGNATVTFQGGVGANCASVPVKNRTWGQLKSLYR